MTEKDSVFIPEVEVPEFMAKGQKIQDQAPFNWLFLDKRGKELFKSFSAGSESEVRYLFLKAVARGNFDPKLKTFGWITNSDDIKIVRGSECKNSACSEGMAIIRRWNTNLQTIDEVAKYVTELMTSYDYWREYVKENYLYFKETGSPYSDSIKYSYAAYAESKRNAALLHSRVEKNSVLLGIGEVFPQSVEEQVGQVTDLLRGKGKTNKVFRLKAYSGLLS